MDPDLSQYDYLVGSFHVDDDDKELYQVDRVAKWSQYAGGDEIIVAFRKRVDGVEETRVDNDDPIHIGDIIRMNMAYNRQRGRSEKRQRK